MLVWKRLDYVKKCVSKLSDAGSKNVETKIQNWKRQSLVLRSGEINYFIYRRCRPVCSYSWVSDALQFHPRKIPPSGHVKIPVTGLPERCEGPSHIREC